MLKLATLFGLLTLIFGITVAGGLASRTAEAQQSTNADSSVTVESVPNSSVADQLKDRAGISWPWYLTRSSGLVAALVLTVLMLSGIGMITGHTFSWLEPAKGVSGNHAYAG